MKEAIAGDETRRPVVVDSREAEIDRAVEGLVQEMAKSPDDGQKISDAIYYLIEERASLLRTPRRRRTG